MSKSKLIFLCSLVLGHAHLQAQVNTVQSQSVQQHRPGVRVTADPVPELNSQAPSPSRSAGPLGSAQANGGMPPVTQPGSGPRPSPLPLERPDLKSEALDRIAPLNPAEILQLRGDLEKRSKAMHESLEHVAKPVRRQVVMDLSPGAVPETIRISYAQGSVLSFVDAAGRPWKVAQIENFHPTGLDAATFGENSVTVGLKVPAARAGNVAILLNGLAAPLMFMFNTGQRESDYAVEAQLPRFLPGEPAPVGVANLPPALGSTMLMDFLLNTPPKNAKTLTTDSASVQAWQISDQKMIVRAEGWVPVPVFTKHQSSQSGVNVFEVPLSPFVLVTTKSTNSLNRVAISGFNSINHSQEKK